MKNYKFSIMVAVAAFFTLIGDSSSQAGDIERFSFFDPYWVCRTYSLAWWPGNDSADIYDHFAERNWYFGQLDSCGLNHTHSFLDRIIIEPLTEFQGSHFKGIMTVDHSVAPIHTYRARRFVDDYIQAGETIFDFIPGVGHWRSYWLMEPPDSVGVWIEDPPNSGHWQFMTTEVPGVFFRASLPTWTRKYGQVWYHLKLQMKLTAEELPDDTVTVCVVTVKDTSGSIQYQQDFENYECWPNWQLGSGWYDPEPPDRDANEENVFPLTVQDFADSGAIDDYGMFEWDSIKLGGGTAWRGTIIEVEWLVDTTTIYLDYAYMCDEYFWQLHKQEQAAREDLYDQIQDSLHALVEDYLEVDPNTLAEHVPFLALDEPPQYTLASVRLVDSLAKEEIGVGLNGPTGWIGKSQLNTFLNFTGINDVIYNAYPIKSNIGTSSEPGDSSIQNAWDLLMDVNGANEDMGLKNVASLLRDRANDEQYSFMMQVSEGWVYNRDTRTWTKQMRDPTPQEILCQGWLGLTYGAKGIAYYMYPSLYDWARNSDTSYCLYPAPSAGKLFVFV